jgi:hypothetical protein
MIGIMTRMIADTPMGTDDCGHADAAEVVENDAVMIIWDVRIYQVIDVQCTRSAEDNNAITYW